MKSGIVVAECLDAVNMCTSGVLNTSQNAKFIFTVLYNYDGLIFLLTVFGEHLLYFQVPEVSNHKIITRPTQFTTPLVKFTWFFRPPSSSSHVCSSLVPSNIDSRTVVNTHRGSCAHMLAHRDIICMSPLCSPREFFQIFPCRDSVWTMGIPLGWRPWSSLSSNSVFLSVWSWLLFTYTRGHCYRNTKGYSNSRSGFLVCCDTTYTSNSLFLLPSTYSCLLEVSSA